MNIVVLDEYTHSTFDIRISLEFVCMKRKDIYLESVHFINLRAVRLDGYSGDINGHCVTIVLTVILSNS